MKKFYIPGLALLAVLAASAFVASSAFAESEILLNGAAITALIPFSIEGELLLEDTGATPKIDLHCSGIFDGFLHEGGKLILIEELLMLDGTLLNELGVLNGAGNDMIDCTASPTGDCAKNEALLTVNLNGTTVWHLELELDAGGQYLVHLLTAAESGEANVVTPMYTVDCETIIGLVEDLCEGLLSARVISAAGGVIRAYFNKLALTEAFGAESEAATCTLGGAGTSILESEKGGGAETDTEASGAAITSSSGTFTLS